MLYRHDLQTHHLLLLLLFLSFWHHLYIPPLLLFWYPLLLLRFLFVLHILCTVFVFYGFNYFTFFLDLLSSSANLLAYRIISYYAIIKIFVT
jgi:hypothetical protein